MAGGTGREKRMRFRESELADVEGYDYDHVMNPETPSRKPQGEKSC